MNLFRRKTSLAGATAEEILRAEYHAAQEQFDMIKESSPDQDAIHDVTRRYLNATVRLRKYLVNREVPRDVAEQLRIR